MVGTFCRLKRMFHPTPQQLYNCEDLNKKLNREKKQNKWGMMDKYSRTASGPAKISIMFAALIVMVVLPALCTWALVAFVHDATVTTKVEWKVATSIDYPNITVCNARYFDTRLLRKYNLSDDVAAYMLYSLDSSIKQFVEFFEVELGDNYTRMLRVLDSQLKQTMAQYNFTDLLQLYKAVAIRCQDFVTFCEVHRQFLVAPGTGYDSFPYCCGNLFDVEPFFTPSGTCFSTKVRVEETLPSTFSNIRVWLGVIDAITPVFNMNILGTDGADRDGIFWTVTHVDHPGRILYSDPHRTKTGTSSLVGLSIREEDRTQLPDVCTTPDDQAFLEMYGIPKTYYNCQALTGHYFLPNCSMSVYMGIKQLDGRPPCTPSDVLSQNKSLSSSDPLVNGSSSLARVSTTIADADCPYNCNHLYYDTKVTEGTFDRRSVEKFFEENRQDYQLYHANQTALIQFYFETFNYPKNSLIQEGFLEFVSKIGGWLGFAIGGSLISFLELLCFMVYLIVVLVKDLRGR